MAARPAERVPHHTPHDGAPLPPAAAPGTARTGPLAGRTVLLPRLREPDSLAEALERAGATVVRAALTRTVRGQADQLDAVCHDLVTGGAAWLVLTSARTVEALATRLPQALAGRDAVRSAGHGPEGTGTTASGDTDEDALADASGAAVTTGTRPGLAHLPATVRVAAVGPATARAWEELTGRAPDVVASGSAAALLTEPALAAGPHATGSGGPQRTSPGKHPGEPGLVAGAQQPAPLTAHHPTPGAPAPAHAGAEPAGTRLLLPASALADPALAQGLGQAGWDVQQVEAYTTVSVSPEQLPAGLPCRWREGDVDAVVLTAPSTTRALLGLLGPPPDPTRVVTIGATTAQAAQAAGLEVDAVAASPTPAGVGEAVERALPHSSLRW